MVSSRRLYDSFQLSLYCIDVSESLHQLESDIGQIQGLGSVGEVNCCIHVYS